MKRLVLSVIGLLALAPQAFGAYDGPSPALTYDRPSPSFRVVFTVQPMILHAGRPRFTFTAFVPIVAGSTSVRMEIHDAGILPPEDPLLDSCTTPVLPGQVGTTAVFTCEIFPLVFAPGGGSKTFFPRVVRDPGTGLELVHDGLGNGLTTPVVGDDGFEPNSVFPSFLVVGSGTPLHIIDLVSQDKDFYMFTAPAGTGLADILIEFWNDASDIDLFLYDGSFQLLDAQTASGPDSHRSIVSTVPGQSYVIEIRADSAETGPAFYDMTITPGPAHTLDGNPSGAPNPVASGGQVNLTANASDTLGHALTYEWRHQCSAEIGLGTFDDRNSPTPVWTAPVNTTGSSKICSMIVVIDDGIVAQVQRSFFQTIETQAVVHSLTISTAPDGAPDPVPSHGMVVLSVAASDTLGHTLSYAWQASCPTLGGNGTFTPSGNVQNPTWTAPVNSTDSQKTCTLSVTVTDGLGLNTSANFNEIVLPEAQLTHTYYFAEGATANGFFETRLALLNADPTNAATVSLDFQLATGTTLTYSLNIPAHTRTTIDVSALASVPGLAALASAEFSTVVQADRPLVADRTMWWTKALGYGSHAETSVSAPAEKWYLAEGATIGNFELYYLIQNPNPEAIEFTVTYLLPPPSAPIVRTYPVGASTRTNIPVHLEANLGEVEVSAVIESPAGKPIIVERAMYLTTGPYFYGAGHESAGITSTETQWFFAEGATGSFFDLFILIGNPGATAAHITATFLFTDGTTCSTDATVDPMSRYNIWVDATVIDDCPGDLSNAAVSTTIESDVPVIAERAMWWPGPTPATWAEAHNAAGATTTGTRWGLAGGEQGGAASNETYILIANTSNFGGTARVTLYFENGASAQIDVVLAANSRTNVAVGAPTDAGGFGAAVQNKRFGAIIESLPGGSGTPEIVVERAMYSNGPGAAIWAAGTDLLATKLD